jgi:protein-tyrosine phosphatase
VSGDPARTSYQLRVDWVPRSALALPGRLGLTRAPGRWAEGRPADPTVWLREDLDALSAVHGAKMLVTLLERVEIAELGDLEDEARRAGLRWVHFPIPDMWVPADAAATRRLVLRVLRALERGEDVVVHCWGGLGRAGTIAACCLVAQGCEPRRALSIVRSARPGAVQSIQQELFVREFVSAPGATLG